MTDPMLSSLLPSANPITADAAAPRAGAKTDAKAEAWRAAAEEFEAVFLAQMLATMTQGSGLQGLGGASADGNGQDVYQDMFTQEVAKLISRTGGIGVADAILQEMLKTQEVT
jgi:Rod binding domain-containing protein